MYITNIELLRKLNNAVTPQEWFDLREDSEFPMSRYNKVFLLQMKRTKISWEEEKEISMQEILKLRNLLKAFLKEYMADKPQWWKWIIIACIYRTYIAEKPMHPLPVVGIQTDVINGRKIYYCPEKDDSKNSVCRYCVCRKLEKE